MLCFEQCVTWNSCNYCLCCHVTSPLSGPSGSVSQLWVWSSWLKLEGCSCPHTTCTLRPRPHWTCTCTEATPPIITRPRPCCPVSWPTPTHSSADSSSLGRLLIIGWTQQNRGAETFPLSPETSSRSKAAVMLRSSASVQVTIRAGGLIGRSAVMSQDTKMTTVMTVFLQQRNCWAVMVTIQRIRSNKQPNWSKQEVNFVFKSFIIKLMSSCWCLRLWGQTDECFSVWFHFSFLNLQ